MSDIILMLVFLVDVALFWLWVQKIGKERFYNLHVYRGERRVELVSDVTGMDAAMESAEDWFMVGAEQVMISDKRGMCKRLFTRDDYEKEGSVYF